MKKIIAMVSVLAAVAACTTPTEDVNRVATTNTNTSETRPSVPVPTEAEAMAKEKATWETIKNKDYEAFSAMLASDQIYVGPEGVHDKAATLDGLKRFELTEATFSDWKFQPIDNNAYAIIYNASVKGKLDGKDLPQENWWNSSVWVNRDGKWVSIFHQESKVTPPPPAPSPAAATKAAPTPVSIVTGPDPIANESALWQALKGRDFNAFESSLASDSIEVEPTGVYDKAGTMKLVRDFDFSKAALGNFRSVKLSDSAALVTYLVKIPSPGQAAIPLSAEGEQHSTIWANRNGKWQAVFHHGTPLMKAAPPPKSAAK